jgi:BirA family biotin operon repressor/biotin-[acetyl-CoA-carboxylase] ligase
LDINIRKYENVSSTNSLAEKLIIDKKLQENTAIFADFQTAGKGQQNNVWHSEKGKNILASFVFFPEKLNIESFFILNQLASLAIIKTLEEIIPETGLKIKWPNDILFDKMKISGILIQNNIEGNHIKNTIIGLGINVNQTDFPEIEIEAASVKSLTKENYPLESLKISLIQNMIRYYEMVDNKKI